jgi:hypothetical protein
MSRNNINKLGNWKEKGLIFLKRKPLCKYADNRASLKNVGE